VAAGLLDRVIADRRRRRPRRTAPEDQYRGRRVPPTAEGENAVRAISRAAGAATGGRIAHGRADQLQSSTSTARQRPSHGTERDGAFGLGDDRAGGLARM